MPNNWKTYKLEEVLDALIDYRGKTPKKKNFGIPLITAKIVKQGKILEPTEFISVEDYNGWMTRGMPKIGDVVLTTEAPLGEVAQLKDSNIALAQRIVTLRGKKDFLDNGYLKYFLQSKEGQKRLVARESGTTVSGIKQSELRKVLIDFPSYIEQKSIASILSAIDDKIENNLAINKTLEEMAMGLYKHWFVDFGPFQDGEFVESELGMIPKGWEVKSVYDIANYINGAAFKPSELVDEGKYVIKISELNGGITKNTGKSTKEVKQEQIINDGSVLFSWSATLDIFLWDKGEALLNQHIFNVLPNGSLSIETLYFLLKNIIAHFKAIAADRATTMGHIKLSHLKETFLAIPNEIHKQEFQNEIEPIFSQILENLTENQTLTQLRDTLLPKLISGEVRLKEFQES